MFFARLIFMTKISKKIKKENFSAYLSIWLSIVGNAILFALKFYVGLISKSVAIMADAWHTLSDSYSSVIVLVGIKVSEREPTKKFPYGFGRADTIASGILSFMLAIVAYEFAAKGIEKLIHKETADYGVWVYIALGLTIVLKEIMARISIWAAIKTDKKSLKADAWHHRSDALSSAIIIVGAILNQYFCWIDGVLAIIVALIIAYTAFEIMRDVAKSIIGESPDEEFAEKIKEIVNSTAKFDICPHHLHIHKYGNHIELTFHIYLPDDFQIQTAHNLTDEIEKKLKDKMNITATIHVEPLKQKKVDMN